MSYDSIRWMSPRSRHHCQQRYMKAYGPRPRTNNHYESTLIVAEFFTTRNDIDQAASIHCPCIKLLIHRSISNPRKFPFLMSFSFYDEVGQLMHSFTVYSVNAANIAQTHRKRRRRSRRETFGCARLIGLHISSQAVHYKESCSSVIPS
jgi:hypothetical protein